MLPRARFNIFCLLEPQLKGNVIKLVNSIGVTKVTDHKQYQVIFFLKKKIEAGHMENKNQKKFKNGRKRILLEKVITAHLSCRLSFRGRCVFLWNTIMNHLHSDAAASLKNFIMWCLIYSKLPENAETKKPQNNLSARSGRLKHFASAHTWHYTSYH